MVERFHRQLKAALKSHPNPLYWTKSLPIVLLGIRSAIKEDIGCTSAELVYGTTLRLPGSYFSPAPPISDSSDYVNHLKITMHELRAVPPRQSTTRVVHVPPQLFTQSHVFVWHDAVHSPLQSPYDGPYRVISRTRKHFTVDVKGKHEIISIDRLKGAHLESEKVVIPTQFNNSHLPPVEPPVITRSGRRVQFPSRLDL